VLTGSIGSSTRGCSPVRVRKKAAMAATSSLFSPLPSWLVPMIETACSRSQTLPVWT
jgi:hypothetical protein